MNDAKNLYPRGSTMTAFTEDYNYTSAAIPMYTTNNVIIAQEQPLEIDENLVGRYSVFDVANWFLNKAPMTQKKLQKLCYYAQAWCFALNEYQLEDTEYEAWVHGPVSPVLWEKFKVFGYDCIRLKNPIKSNIKSEDEKLLNDVWDTYGSSTGNALEVLTHRELPWKEARKGYEPYERCSVVISHKTMASYYKSIYSGE